MLARFHQSYRLHRDGGPSLEAASYRLASERGRSLCMLIGQTGRPSGSHRRTEGQRAQEVDFPYEDGRGLPGYPRTAGSALGVASDARGTPGRSYSQTQVPVPLAAADC